MSDFLSSIVSNIKKEQTIKAKSEELIANDSEKKPKKTRVAKPKAEKSETTEPKVRKPRAVKSKEEGGIPLKTGQASKEKISEVKQPVVMNFHEDFVRPQKSELGALTGGRMDQAEKKLVDMVKQYNVDLIAIGNGTASRESEKFVSEVIKKYNLPCKFLIVSEAGASVYSASELANKEYPNLDVTVRGAISIAHRLQDPLAELIKIDPKSIGVGQYQHDVDQKLLKEMLEKKIEDTVNRVGVDVNSASVPLLTYIAGLNAKAAQAIVDHRDANGPFADRKAIKKVKGIGPKAYEQAIGFLRVPNSKELLDRTGIHPETYELTYKILEQEFKIKKSDLKLPLDLISQLSDHKIRELAGKYESGDETLRDIFKELANPGLDPRENFDEQLFRSDILDIKDLQPGMMLTGVVRNITDFGAFVDIGLHNDGLVHKSQMADYYVENPMDVVTIGQTVEARVLSIDLEKEKVSLSMKTEGAQAQGAITNRPNSVYTKKSSTNDKPLQSEKEDDSAGSGLKGNITFSRG